MSDGRVSLEDVIIALSKECDGAVRRDNRGFSRSDSIEGSRLAAMISSDTILSSLDLKKAKELGANHAMQAAELLGRTDKAKRTLTDMLKKRKLELRCGIINAQECKKDMALRSTGGRYVDLWMQNWRDDHRALVSDIKRLRHIRHGERVETPRFDKTSRITIHGKENTMPRWRLPYNGSTLPAILRITEDYGFVTDKSIRNGPDPVIDELRKSAKACWLGGTKKRPLAVFDLAQKNIQFSRLIKHCFRGKFTCSASDDWNWHVEWSAFTKKRILQIINEFSFNHEPSMQSTFTKN